MNNSDKEDGVVFSKGISLKDLMSETGSEFQLDINFKGKKDKFDPLLMDKNDINYDLDEASSSDAEDVLKEMAQSAELKVLASPEYVSFDDLAYKMIDCVPTGDIKILIIEEGETLVPEDAQVTVHYAAYWEKEKIPFDSTLTMNYGAPAKFKLGTGHLIAGLEIGLTTVKGPKAMFYLMVSPSAAWGKLGVPPRIRAERALFSVSLLAVSDRAAIDRFNVLPKEEQQKFATSLNTATASNAAAKEFFIKRAYRKAAKHYHKSLYVLQMSRPETEAEKADINKLMCSVYVNLALCYYKLKLPYKILLMCDELGRICNIETNCKGLYFYGKAFQLEGKYDEAETFYKKALKLEPKNPDIGKALSDLNDIVERGAKNERDMWRSAFKNNMAERKKEDGLDEEFKYNLKETCEDLASRKEYAKFDLPSGLTRKEVDYIRNLTQRFECLSVLEEGEGYRYKVSIVKRNTAECAWKQ